VSSVRSRKEAGTYWAVEIFEEDNKPKCRIREFTARISIEMHTYQWQRDSYVTDVDVYVMDALWRRVWAETEDALNVADVFTIDPGTELLTSAAEIISIAARRIVQETGAAWYEVKVEQGATVTERVIKDGPAQKLREVKGWYGDCVGAGRVVAVGDCSDIYSRASAHNDRQEEEAMKKYPEGVVE